MSFWSEENWNNGYEGPDAGQHRAVDVEHPARTPIPALRAGKVVAIRFHAGVGWYITLQIAPAVYDSYCHVYDSRVSVGHDVKAGQTIALVAGRNDNPGNEWTGSHVHFTVTNGPSPLTAYTASNPEPIIRQHTLGRQDGMTFEHTRRSTGSIQFVDGFGNEDIATYRSPDIGLQEYVDAVGRLASGAGAANDRQFDVMVAIAGRRRAAVENRIAAKVAAIAKQVVAGIGTPATGASAAAIADELAKRLRE